MSHLTAVADNLKSRKEWRSGYSTCLVRSKCLLCAAEHNPSVKTFLFASVLHYYNQYYWNTSITQEETTTAITTGRSEEAHGLFPSTVRLHASPHILYMKNIHVKVFNTQRPNWVISFLLWKKKRIFSFPRPPFFLRVWYRYDRQHLEIPDNCPVLLMHIHISEGEPEVSYSVCMLCVPTICKRSRTDKSNVFWLHTPLSSIHQDQQGTASNTVSRRREIYKTNGLSSFPTNLTKFGKSSSTCQLAETATGAVSSESHQQQRGEDWEQEEVHGDSCTCSFSLSTLWLDVRGSNNWFVFPSWFSSGWANHRSNRFTIGPV